jgi:hypothetical protein
MSNPVHFFSHNAQTQTTQKICVNNYPSKHKDAIRITAEQKNKFSMPFLTTQGDYKRRETLQTFIGNKVISIQKLNAHYYKEQLKKFIFFIPYAVQ